MTMITIYKKYIIKCHFVLEHLSAIHISAFATFLFDFGFFINSNIKFP